MTGLQRLLFGGLCLTLTHSLTADNGWTPITEFPDHENVLEFDFRDIRIGSAEYEEGPTGATVFYFPKGAQAAVDQRGGFSGTVLMGSGYVDAICFAGGSLAGLQATTGVTEAMLKQRNSVRWFDIPVVRGAIIYDFLPRDNLVFPDAKLGAAAYEAAETGKFYIGRRGAGRHASVGVGFDAQYAEWGGQGGAFRQVGRTKIAVFAILNPLGAIHDRSGEVVLGNRDRRTGETFSIAEDVDRRLKSEGEVKTAAGRTTLTLVVTNQKLTPHELRSLARQVNASMGRAIQPYNAIDDGDILYAVTTNQIVNRKIGVTALGVIASEVAWDAALSIVPERE